MSESIDVEPPASIDWASDFDVLAADYVADPYPIWSQLRDECPVAHTDRQGGSWLLTRYEDVAAALHNVPTFSSGHPGVVDIPDLMENLPEGLIPLKADPPVHTWSRRLLLPYFSHDRVEEYEALTREYCRQLMDNLASRSEVEASLEYAQKVPVWVISTMLGIPPQMIDAFAGWIREAGDFSDQEKRSRADKEIFTLLRAQIADRRAAPGPDLISSLMSSHVEGVVITDDVVLSLVYITLIAGIDTTHHAIGLMLWHLASHDHDRQRLLSEPDLWKTAIEELLRAYSPVSAGRIVARDTELHGCPMSPGDRVVLAIGSANRDEAMFPDADRVILDRAVNRHIAFGLGIHRCAGSNLARMELRVALEEWLARVPTFHLVDPQAVEWEGAVVRGPGRLPLVLQ